MVDVILEALELKFGKMTIKRGKKHTFVGMDIEFIKDRRVKISMIDYIKECMSVYGEDKLKNRRTPAGHDLFDTNDESPQLNEECSDLFHDIVAKLLYVSKRARLDIEPTRSFLCTRVSKSTQEDWTKLGRLLGYLKGTLDMPRIIGCDRLDVFYSWADASYAIHPDMKGHTGGVTSFGVGVTHTKCSKQKINTKSSTESEIVGASDYITFMVWLAGFMLEQGMVINKKIFFQDNMSAMQIEKNGIFSSSAKTRHLNIRHFFIKDILQRENIDMKHCPTMSMIADFFTKPQQGKLYKRMRSLIMGHVPFTMEECVGILNIPSDVSIVEECPQTDRLSKTNQVTSVESEPTYVSTSSK